jgi:hypothetical protein
VAEPAITPNEARLVANFRSACLLIATAAPSDRIRDEYLASARAAFEAEFGSPAAASLVLHLAEQGRWQ